MISSNHAQKDRPGARRGFTLPELATAILLSLVIAAIMMTLLQQQVSFHRIIRAQNFLVEEAPQINNSITQIMARADAFRIHSNLSDAVSDANAVTSDGKVLVVGFLNPDGSREFGLISFEAISGENQLGYYRVDSNGSLTNSGDADWLISRRVANASFFVESGVFRMQLTGPAGEQITYSGTPRL
jgi:prepilin-type N-terminal cleavage/methylation domain-containing protein